jgi:methionyl-tRNA formyltransferase
MGGSMVTGLLDQLAAGKKLPHTKQDDSLSVYAPLLKKTDGAIDWTKSAAEIDRQVRALNPWPGTYTLNENSVRLKILAGELTTNRVSVSAGTIVTGGGVVCGDGVVYRLTRVQPDNSKAMDAVSAINGGHLKVGQSCQSGS